MQRRKTLGPVGGGLLLSATRSAWSYLCRCSVYNRGKQVEYSWPHQRRRLFREREKSTQALTIEESHNDIRSIGRVTPMLVS